MQHTIGQFLGILAAVASAIMPLYKKKWQMLINTTAVNILVASNLLLIGQVGSAVFLCSVAAVQCLVALLHNHRHTAPGKAETLVFLCLYLFFGFFGMMTAPGFQWAINYRNLLELLPICGALLSMVFVFIPDEQKARWVLLSTCSIWSVYTALVGSTAFFSQFISLIITVVALWKYRKTGRKH